jgi:periplasmic copper chaperone A
MQEFGLSIRTANGRPGEKAHFRILQECERGETAWAEIPVEGEEEPEHPAAEVVFAAGDGHGGGADAAQEPVAAEQAASVSAADVDGKASKGLGVAALIVGGLGLAVGAVGVTLARRRPGGAA